MPQHVVHSPLGAITIVVADGCIARVMFGDHGDDGQGDALLDEASAQIAAWLGGKRRSFDLPLAPVRSRRGTNLRDAITAVGYGETASYGAVARAVASGARAVGQACARNPLPIIVPCHRIVGAGGSLGHYTGGDGIVTKRALLAIEARNRFVGETAWAA